MNAVATIEVAYADAALLALLVKRLAWPDFLGCAVDADEARDMVQAVQRLQASLALAGFAPR